MNFYSGMFTLNSYSNIRAYLFNTEIISCLNLKCLQVNRNPNLIKDINILSCSNSRRVKLKHSHQLNAHMEIYVLFVASLNVIL